MHTYCLLDFVSREQILNVKYGIRKFGRQSEQNSIFNHAVLGDIVVKYNFIVISMLIAFLRIQNKHTLPLLLKVGLDENHLKTPARTLPRYALPTWVEYLVANAFNNVHIEQYRTSRFHNTVTIYDDFHQGKYWNWNVQCFENILLLLKFHLLPQFWWWCWP